MLVAELFIYLLFAVALMAGIAFFIFRFYYLVEVPKYLKDISDSLKNLEIIFYDENNT